MIDAEPISSQFYLGLPELPGPWMGHDLNGPKMTCPQKPCLKAMTQWRRVTIRRGAQQAPSRRKW